MHMDGYFNENNEPAIGLNVGARQMEFLVDTGFTGSLIIPEELANDLEITYNLGLEEFHSVTGKAFPARSGSIAINWLGKRVQIPVSTSSEVSEALLGGHMLRDCCLMIDYGRRTVVIAESLL